MIATMAPAITARPPTTPPTMGPIGVFDGLGIGIGVGGTVVWEALDVDVLDELLENEVVDDDDDVVDAPMVINSLPSCP